MSMLPKPNAPLHAQSTRNNIPRRLIVTASVVIFAVRNWSLWVLLREGPWGAPMRLVLGNEAVSDAVERTTDALLLWPETAPILRLKAGWQEQQVHVWGSEEEGAAVSLIHTLLVRANYDELRPNLRHHAVPSLRVEWAEVAEIEAGQRALDADVLPVVQMALHTLRAHVQRNPEIVLRYLADMYVMGATDAQDDWWKRDADTPSSRDTRPFSMLKEPQTGDGTLTLAEATLLYRAFFPADEQIDLSNLRRRFLNTNKLAAIDEERPVRGRELDWRRVSRAYRYEESL